MLGPSSPSASMSVQVLNLPATPTNLNVMLLSATSVQLTWMDNANNETGYRVERAPDTSGQPGTFSQVGTNLAPDTTTLTDTIVAGEIWHYRVIAFSTILGDSSPSAVIAISYAAPTAPNNITTMVTASITVGWTDNSTNETGFQVLRAPDNAGSAGTFAALDADPGIRDSKIYQPMQPALWILQLFRATSTGTR